MDLKTQNLSKEALAKLKEIENTEIPESLVFAINELNSKVNYYHNLWRETQNELTGANGKLKKLNSAINTLKEA